MTRLRKYTFLQKDLHIYEKSSTFAPIFTTTLNGGLRYEKVCLSGSFLLCSMHVGSSMHPKTPKA
jgi:hypothetical protein